MKLTKTEREILTRLQRGDSTKRIACDLVVTCSTVNRHISNIMTKCGVNSRHDLPGMAKPALTPWQEQIISLYERNLSYRAIAAELNTEIHSISVAIWRMRRTGIPIPYRNKVALCQ